MSKVVYNQIIFDSQLEVDYYKELENCTDVVRFKYHPKKPFVDIVGKRSYTPDFIVIYNDRIEIVETKGYNPYSVRIDDAIHEAMLRKSESDLRLWLSLNNITSIGVNVIYRKIKFIKAYGFVDWDFKNPNTLANKRKEKILEQKDEIKELRDFKKEALRYFSYRKKIESGQKLTKQQSQWLGLYVDKWIYGEEIVE